MTAPNLVLHGIERQLGGTTVLAIDHLELTAGSTAVLGPNGAGKTTLLRLLATVDAPTTGSLRIGGLDPSEPEQRTRIRRQLGFAMQHDRLPDRMRVGAFCDYIAALKQIEPARRRARWVSWCLSEVGLTERRGDRIGELSGGMRRRLLIAQSLIGAPNLVVLDEPLASLDAEHRSSLLHAITSTTDRTTIVATHHADEVAAACRHVVVLVHGRVCFTGSPGDLATRAAGRTFETSQASGDPSARVVAPGRVRVVGRRPADGVEVQPSVHDGYVAVVADASLAGVGPVPG